METKLNSERIICSRGGIGCPAVEDVEGGKGERDWLSRSRREVGGVGVEESRGLRRWPVNCVGGSLLLLLGDWVFTEEEEDRVVRESSSVVDSWGGVVRRLFVSSSLLLLVLVSRPSFSRTRTCR